MDEPLELPVIAVEDAPGTALILLPGINMDRLEQVSFEVEDAVLRVTCLYQEDQSFEYAVKITDENRGTIDSMERLAVMNPSQVEPKNLSSDPEQIKHLRRVMEDVKSLANDSESDLPDPEALENGQNGVS